MLFSDAASRGWHGTSPKTWQEGGLDSGLDCEKECGSPTRGTTWERQEVLSPQRRAARSEVRPTFWSLNAACPECLPRVPGPWTGDAKVLFRALQSPAGAARAPSCVLATPLGGGGDSARGGTAARRYSALGVAPRAARSRARLSAGGDAASEERRCSLRRCSLRRCNLGRCSLGRCSLGRCNLSDQHLACVRRQLLPMPIQPRRPRSLRAASPSPCATSESRRGPPPSLRCQMLKAHTRSS